MTPDDWPYVYAIYTEGIATAVGEPRRRRRHLDDPDDLGFRVVGRRERIAKLHGVWRETLLPERRSPTIGRTMSPRAEPR